MFSNKENPRHNPTGIPVSDTPIPPVSQYQITRYPRHPSVAQHRTPAHSIASHTAYNKANTRKTAKQLQKAKTKAPQHTTQHIAQHTYKQQQEKQHRQQQKQNKDNNKDNNKNIHRKQKQSTPTKPAIHKAPPKTNTIIHNTTRNPPKSQIQSKTQSTSQHYIQAQNTEQNQNNLLPPHLTSCTPPYTFNPFLNPPNKSTFQNTKTQSTSQKPIQ